MRHRSFAVVTAAALLISPGAWALDAEYAIRWDPSQGGPDTLDKVVSDLGQKVKKRQQAVVTYLQVVPASPLPEGHKLIARERVFAPLPGDASKSAKKKDGAKREVMMKLRVPEGQLSAARQWVCPLMGSTQSKLESDISWPPSPQTRAVSASCKAEDRSMMETIPAALKPRPGPCAASTMVRVKTEQDITIERWILPSGRVIVEVSLSASDDKEGIDQFRNLVVAKLNGIQPLPEGMTTLASSCSSKR